MEIFLRIRNFAAEGAIVGYCKTWSSKVSITAGGCGMKAMKTIDQPYKDFPKKVQGLAARSDLDTKGEAKASGFE